MHRWMSLFSLFLLIQGKTWKSGINQRRSWHRQMARREYLHWASLDEPLGRTQDRPWHHHSHLERDSRATHGSRPSHLPGMHRQLPTPDSDPLERSPAPKVPGQPSPRGSSPSRFPGVPPRLGGAGPPLMATGATRGRRPSLRLGATALPLGPGEGSGGGRAARGACRVRPGGGGGRGAGAGGARSHRGGRKQGGGDLRQ